MKKVLTSLLSIVLICAIIVTPVLADPSIDELKEGKKAAEEAVASMQAELTELLVKLDELETQLIAKGEEIIQAESDLKDAEAVEKEQYEAMKLRIRYLYESGDTSFIEAQVTDAKYTDEGSKAEYVEKVNTYDRQKLLEYIEIKEQIKSMKEQLENEKAQLEDLQTQYESKKVELDDLIARKQNEIADFDQKIQAAIEEAARRAAEEAARRAAEAAARAAAARAAASSSGNSANASAVAAASLEYSGTGNTETAQKIIDAAISQLGVPYVWGGTKPGVGLDCSGLTQYCHRVAGISIPRTSQVQGGGGKAVSDPQPGDLVCYGHHIGIYIGGGKMIHAPHTGDVVRVAAVYGRPWYRRYW
ncbi:MAG: C40 family peptidase [Lachnospiraceae bacterium]|jgi:cell wall-associated NlpC family hydrolase|nr:C40 family peptidase [Lachnospiraceae bacterium]